MQLILSLNPLMSFRSVTLIIQKRYVSSVICLAWLIHFVPALCQCQFLFCWKVRIYSNVPVVPAYPSSMFSATCYRCGLYSIWGFVLSFRQWRNRCKPPSQNCLCRIIKEVFLYIYIYIYIYSPLFINAIVGHWACSYAASFM